LPDPSLDDAGVLTFRNASVDADFAKAPAGYRAVWFRFDNATSRTVRIADTQARSTWLRRRAAAVPRRRVRESRTEQHRGSPAILAPADQRLLPATQGQWQLVGLERTPS
jgi:hypothetical protein